MDTTELLGALNNILNNFVIGLVALRLVPPERWASLTNRNAVFQGPNGKLLTIDLTPLVQNIQRSKDRKILIDEFEKAMKRATLRECHEVILWYTEETKQVDVYKSAPWFQFARILRNVASHKQGGTLREWPMELLRKGIQRVYWRNRVLDASMIGQEIEFTHHEALQLLADQLDFVRTQLA